MESFMLGVGRDYSDSVFLANIGNIYADYLNQKPIGL